MAERNANVELKAHAGTYGSFLGLMKWGTIAAAILAAIVVLLISR